MELTRIFLSYRRDDTGDARAYLLDPLVERFGSDIVFFDQTSIRPGQNWREAIRSALSQTDVFVLLVSNEWRSPSIDDSSDILAFELEVARERQLPIMPVLMPGVEQLSPTDLDKSLHYLFDFQWLQNCAPDEVVEAVAWHLKRSVTLRFYQYYLNDKEIFYNPFRDLLREGSMFIDLNDERLKIPRRDYKQHVEIDAKPGRTAISVTFDAVPSASGGYRTVEVTESFQFSPNTTYDLFINFHGYSPSDFPITYLAPVSITDEGSVAS